MRWRGLLAPLGLLAGGVVFGQGQDEPMDREGVPMWEVDKDNPDDVFTFVRVKYTGFRRRRGNDWETDYPAADLYLSYRLQQLTSLKVAPWPKAMRVTDPALADYPFIYLVEPGGLQLSDDEAQALRRYLLGGGFLMVDDFWGVREWENFYTEIKKVFPEREPQELDLSHPIFNAVFPIKSKPQVPSIHYFQMGYTTERADAPYAEYKAFFDDHGRMMVVICHNTDLGDGWEREAEDPAYFRKYSEPMSYPMAINIIFYAMTH